MGAHLVLLIATAMVVPGAVFLSEDPVPTLPILSNAQVLAAPPLSAMAEPEHPAPLSEEIDATLSEIAPPELRHEEALLAELAKWEEQRRHARAEALAAIESSTPEKLATTRTMPAKLRAATSRPAMLGASRREPPAEASHQRVAKEVAKEVVKEVAEEATGKVEPARLLSQPDFGELHCDQPTTVEVAIHVDAEGRASSVELVKGDLPASLLERITSVFLGCRYQPATRGGNAIPCTIRQQVVIR